jgi:putative transposase
MRSGRGVRPGRAGEGLVLGGPPPRDPVPRTPWPGWLDGKPDRIWAYDCTRWARARRAAIAILDVVSGTWLATLTSAKESSAQAGACFLAAPDAGDLPEEAGERATAALRAAIASGGRDRGRRHHHGRAAAAAAAAISSDGPQMRSVTTREFMAGVAIGWQSGRPHTPQGQAWTETLSGHVTGEWPHLETIRGPGEPDAGPDRVRAGYNTVRLHASIGYVTPDDEHEGRGEAIRQARRDGLAAARLNRIAYRRSTTHEENQ